MCGAGEFRHVWAPHPDGTGKETFLYECAGCSVVFLDVTAFNANEPSPPKGRGAPLPKAARQADITAANGIVYGIDAVVMPKKWQLLAAAA